MDDELPRIKNDVLQALILQPLEPLSVSELTQRIAHLQAEIERTQSQLARADHVKTDAEALFRKSI